MSSRQNEISDLPYVGWVPTVNGNLSFRHIGDASHPERAIYANVATDRERLIISFQMRDLSDLFFRPLTHWYFKVRGRFYFVLVVRSNGPLGASSKLTGNIFLFKTRDDWKLWGRKFCQNSIEQLNELRLTGSPDRDEMVRARYETTQEYLLKKADISIAVELMRTGFARFGEPNFIDEELYIASKNYVEVEQQHRFNRILADQCYFFLRDLAHVHQHHGKTSDTILVLQDSRDVSDDEWKRNIVYSLQHYVIRSKRDSSPFSLTQSLGVMAYCRSFMAICSSSGESAAAPLPSYNDAAALQSIQARIQEQEIYENRRAVRRSIGIAVLALVAILVAGMAIFVQPLVTEVDFPNLKSFAVAIVRNISPILIILLLATAVGFVIATEPFQLERLRPWIYYRQFLLDAYELGLAERWASVKWLIFIGMILSFLTLLMGMPAIRHLISFFQ